jgi:2-oxoglutarate ferredoxin oxidoreductase subunit beta
MAPTTLLGQKTTTSPAGREAERNGYPIRMAELLAQLDGVAFSARVAVNKVKNVLQAKKALHSAFDAQLNKKGLGFVEFLSSCPTNWKMTSEAANERVETEMIPYFPLGTFKDRVAESA